MRALGIDTADLGVEMTTRKILDAEGRVVVEAHCPQTLTAWERLYRILRDAFPAAHYHRGVGLKGFEQNADAVTAHFSDGTSARRRPPDRRRRHPLDRAPATLARPQSALRRLCRLALACCRSRRSRRRSTASCSSAWRSACRPASSSSAIRWRGRTTICGRGHRRYNVVWYRPAEEATELRRLLTDDSGTTHTHLDPAAADPPASTSPRCALPPSGWSRRNSAPSRG